MPVSGLRVREEDDATLNRYAAQGDQRAFSALVLRHEARLRGFLRRLAGADIADDLAQEALLRAWRRAQQYDGRGRYEAWLLGIGWRVFLDARRTERAQQAIRRDMGDLHIAASACHPGDAALDVERMLMALDPADRGALLLCVGQGWSHGEAAAIMGLPLGTVKTRVARAQRLARAMLTGDIR